MILPLISVVIPVYNVEKYLRQCLDSVRRQTYRNIEIICVNDGSTDGSLSILKEYQQKDSRFILINQRNQGISAARNAGLERVSSDYVSFIDSDDYVDSHYIEVLYDKLCAENADFSCCNILPIGSEISENLKIQSYIQSRMKFSPDFPINPNKITVMAWGKLFKMNIIRKHQLHFPEGLVNEDNYWHFLYCFFSKKYTIAYEKLYFYRQDNSVSTMKKTIFQKEHCYDILKVLCRIFDSLTISDYLNFYRSCLDDYFFSQIEHLMKIHNKRTIDRPFWNEIKEYLSRSKEAEIKFIKGKFFDMLDKKIYFNTSIKKTCGDGTKSKGGEKVSFSVFIKKYLVKFFNKFPIKKNRIVFWHNGYGFGDNPKYIALEMLKHEEFELIWLYNKDYPILFKEFPKKIKLVEYRGIRALYYLATYHIFISSFRQNLLHRSSLRKRKGQFYIHTWHGGYGFKNAEGNYPKLAMWYQKMAIQDSKDIDYVSSCSTWSEKHIFFEREFWYSGKYFRGGDPRNDILFNRPSEIKDKVYRYFNLEPSTRIVMYAPTFRDNHNTGIYQLLDYAMLKEAVESKFPGKWVVLSRLHPHLMKEKNILPEYSWLQNATLYPDMQELLCVTDLLITDYSSSIFDFLITGRPSLIYAPDKEYIERERGFLISFEETPFLIAYNNKQLIDNIKRMDVEKHFYLCHKFLKDTGFYSKGNACQQLIDLIKTQCQ